MKSLLPLLIVLLTSSPSGSAPERRVAKYPYPWGKVTVTYPASIPKQLLDAWMRLSPDLSPYNHLLVPTSVSQCLPDDARYSGCASGVLHVRNIDVNLTLAQKLHDELAVQNLPQSLQPVVKYLLEIQEFNLWRMRSTREFVATGNIDALRTSYRDIDPRLSCLAVLEQIARAEDPRAVSKLAGHDWQNCTWNAEADRIGNYPEKAWQAFTKEKDLVLVNEEESPD